MKKISRQILGSSKRRVTNQRLVLLDILHQENRHLDANELYERARQKQPRLSLATVYRNLRLFKKLGLVDEHHFTEEHFHYEVKSGDEHHHLLCLECGKVVEFDYPLSHQLRQDIGQQYNFEVCGVEIRITGLCPECQVKR